MRRRTESKIVKNPIDWGGKQTAFLMCLESQDNRDPQVTVFRNCPFTFPTAGVDTCTGARVLILLSACQDLGVGRL